MAETQDSQLVLLLLKLEILDQETIDKALSFQERAKEEGKSIPLGAVLVQEKFLPFGQVERLVAHQKDAPLVCKSCQTETGARSLDPREPFHCPSCKEALPETDTALEAFMTIVQDSSAPSRGIKVGQTIAGCRIDRKIGEGGMGAVYQATHEHLDRKVAVKILPEYHVHQPGFADRFLRESRSAAKVMHPNVVQVMDAGIEGETHYIVMEFVEGKSLEDILESEGHVPIPQALKYIRDSALGLEAAAEHGIIHRDIKPDNIRIHPRGIAKVADFGLAKDLESADKISVTGAVMGTPLYMSPEQARGERVDFRSDIYSLGATLYHLVVGKPPFKGPTAMAILRKHTDEDPTPLVQSVEGCPEEVNALVLKMMAKDPANRFASYKALVKAIDTIIGEAKERGDEPSPPVPQPVKKAGWMLPAAVVVIILGVVGVWLGTRGGRKGPDVSDTRGLGIQGEPVTGPEGKTTGDEGGQEVTPKGGDGKETPKGGGEGVQPKEGTGPTGSEGGGEPPEGGDTGATGPTGPGEATGPRVTPEDVERFQPVAGEVRFYVESHENEDLRARFSEFFEEFGLKITEDARAATYVIDISAKFTEMTHPIDKTEGTQLSLRVKIVEASTKEQVLAERNDPRKASVFFGDQDRRHDLVMDKAFEQIREPLGAKVKGALDSMLKVGRDVRIVFKGYQDAHADALEQVQVLLGGVPGVSDIKRRLEEGVLTFEMQYSGKIDALEEALGSKLQRLIPEGERPKVTSISDNRIELSF